MAQTYEGALKIAAKRAGVSRSEYGERIARGEKWCTLCRKWHAREMFSTDASRADGLATSCTRARNEWARTRYRRKPRPAPGRSFVPARNGDRRQARRRINFFVETGLLPQPNALPCTDCGHTWKPGERRHEYDHHLGYAAEHHEHVACVCTRCHRKRDNGRVNP